MTVASGIEELSEAGDLHALECASLAKASFCDAQRHAHLRVGNGALLPANSGSGRVVDEDDVVYTKVKHEDVGLEDDDSLPTLIRRLERAELVRNREPLSPVLAPSFDDRGNVKGLRRIFRQLRGVWSNRVVAEDEPQAPKSALRVRNRSTDRELERAVRSDWLQRICRGDNLLVPKGEGLFGH